MAPLGLKMPVCGVPRPEVRDSNAFTARVAAVPMIVDAAPATISPVAGVAIVTPKLAEIAAFWLAISAGDESLGPSCGGRLFDNPKETKGVDCCVTLG